MMMTIRILFTLAILSCISVVSLAQNDFQSWNTIRVSKKINKTYSASLDQEFRFDHNSSRLGEYFSNLGISHDLNKYISVAANYRFSRELTNSRNILHSHRYHFDLSYGYKFDRIKFSYRARYQSTYDEIGASDDWQVPSSYFRNKISIEYNVRMTRAIPFAEAEIYYRTGPFSAKGFSKYRLTAGINYNLKNGNEVSVFFRRQAQINSGANSSDYILGLMYEFKI